MSAKRGWLLLLVFVGGMTSLGVELTASRLLDPFFGNSLIIWAVLIGMVLLYLTLGYYLGGKWADRRPYHSVLYQITAWSAFMVGIVPFVARPVLLWSLQGFAQYSAGILAGSFLGVLALFAIPVTLMGVISPFAIRLSMEGEGVATAGNVAGGIYALSTVGSLVGTFLPVLVLIPNIGTRNTFLFFAFTLLGVSLGSSSTRARAYTRSMLRERSCWAASGTIFSSPLISTTRPMTPARSTAWPSSALQPARWPSNTQKCTGRSPLTAPRSTRPSSTWAASTLI